MEEYLTTNEVASILKVNILTVRRWIKAKKLNVIFLGKAYRIKRSDFDLFIKNREVSK
jgi:excisionase family DNA binding protein